MREIPPDHPLRFSVAEFNRGIDVFKVMRDISRPFSDHEAAWREVLHRVERIYSKTKAASAGKPDWPAINSEISHLRKTDPLLVYVQQARHADEHSIQHVATDWDAQLSVERVADGSIRVSWKPWDRQLLPVTNRGVTYNPPRIHLGKDLSPLLGKGNEESVIVASKALQFYGRFVNHVSATLFPGFGAGGELTPDVRHSG